MIEYYLWIKAAHLIAVISWMAGMLYLRGCSSITARRRQAACSRRRSR